MKEKFVACLSVLLLVCTLAVPDAFARSVQFTDVPNTKPYAKAVYQLAERNIIGGYPDGTFQPAASITRGQAAAILAKLIELDVSQIKDPGFTDVSPSSWNYKEIAALADKGIINGYGNGKFGPNDPITRAQMATILVRAFKLPPYYYDSATNPFKDTERLGSHQENVYILYKLRITSGTSPTSFSPNAPITRAQAAVLMTKTEDMKSQIVTIRASNFHWNYFSRLPSIQTEDKILQAVPNKKADEIHLIPLREGTETISMTQNSILNGETDSTDKGYRKFYVHITEDNERLNITLEESEDILPTEIRVLQRNQKVNRISLSTMEGSPVDPDVPFKQCSDGFTNNTYICFTLNDPGTFIATAHDSNGETTRYGIEAKANKTSFFYDVHAFEEQPIITVDLGFNEVLGDYVLSDGSENIAEITRERGTNRFYIKGKEEGRVYLKFTDRHESVVGLSIAVSKIGEIIYVYATPETAY